MWRQWQPAGAADPEAWLLAMPADHAMTDAAGFRAAVGTALGLAAAGRLVTFGVVPDAPETGYGYIRRQADGVVAEFVEKPDLTRAEGFLASGDDLWKSGLFLTRVALDRGVATLPAGHPAGLRGGDHEQFLITENESTYIPVGVRHRLENPGLIPLDMIEVQSGSYLGEDDMTRFEDIDRRMEPSVGG